MQEEQNEIKEEVELHDLSKPDFKFVPKGYHEWKQMGPYCVCKSCELEHGIFIGINKHLIGIGDKGEPILESVSS